MIRGVIRRFEKVIPTLFSFSPLSPSSLFFWQLVYYYLYVVGRWPQGLRNPQSNFQEKFFLCIPLFFFFLVQLQVEKKVQFSWELKWKKKGEIKGGQSGKESKLSSLWKLWFLKLFRWGEIRLSDFFFLPENKRKKFTRL